MRKLITIIAITQQTIVFAQKLTVKLKPFIVQGKRKNFYAQQPFIFILTSCLIFFIYSAYGQKLPNIQRNSYRAPINIKIDGKASEWGNQFQAYNNATQVFYTLANDSNNLYLVLQSGDLLIEKKILSGGVLLSISTIGKKDKSPMILKFPLLSESIASGIGHNLNEINPSPKMEKETSKNDSLILLMNKHLDNYLKEIAVKGIPSIEDSVLSVYNSNGIKAFAQFDNNASLTYELAIPLKYLSLIAGKSSKITYNIKVNNIFSQGKVVMLDPGASSNSTMVIIGSSINGKNQSENQALNSDTDFWGEYITL